MKADRDMKLRHLVAAGGPRGMADPATNARVRAWLSEHPMVAGAAPVPAGPLRVETDGQANVRALVAAGVSPDVVGRVTTAATVAVMDVLRRRRVATIFRQSALKGWYLR